MKTLVLTLTFLVFCVSGLIAQQRNLELKLSEGHEYVFEKSYKTYIIKESGEKQIQALNNLVYRLVVEKVDADNQLIVTVNYIEATSDRPANTGLIHKEDCFFPNFIEGVSSRVAGNTTIDPVFCSLKPRFSINLKNGEIKIENRTELLEDVYAILKGKKYSEKNLKSAIEAINEWKLNDQKKQVEFLTWFLNADISTNDSIASHTLKRSFAKDKQEGAVLLLGEQDFTNKADGKVREKYEINTETGLVTDYSTLKLDSIKTSYQRNALKNAVRGNESHFQLLYTQKVPAKQLFVSGKIMNPLSDRIHIRYLHDPFGFDLKTKTISLDENGAFETILDFPRRCFVYIENENKNKNSFPGTYVFYAEPGDTISFNSKGVELPWETTYTGTRTMEAQLLAELRNKVKTPFLDVGSRKIGSVIFFRDILSFRFRRKPNSASLLPPIFEALEKSNQIINSYQSDLSEKAFGFIKNETKAYFYTGLFNSALSEIWNVDNFGVNTVLQYEDFSEELIKVNNLDIHEIYNDYGWHSRKCVGQYVNFQFARTNKIQKKYISSMGNQSPSEVELTTQFSRMILAGSPLYRELGRTYKNIIVGTNYRRFEKNDDLFKKKAIDGLDLMLRTCNDATVTRKAKQIIYQQKRLESGKYVPKINFVDLDKKTVSFKDIAKEKPTVFCFSSDWIGDRYDLDNLALENPEIRIVFIVEGSNYKQWIEYSKRAVPDAEQLLFLNEKQSINDIFHHNKAFLIFDKTGKFVCYRSSTKSSISTAKKLLGVE